MTELKPTSYIRGLSREFGTRSGAPQGFPFSSFLFNFIIKTIMAIALSSCDNSSIGIFADRKLSDLEYANNIRLLNEDPSKFPIFLVLLEDSVSILGRVFDFQGEKILAEVE